jgi:hypothetical protein
VSEQRGTVSRAAWIGGLLAGVLIGVIGIGTLSMFEVHKVTKVAVEMVTVGLALWVTTRIWQRSARTGNNERE